MNWTTLYITGRSDFRADVMEKLQSGRLDVMPGYLERAGGQGFYDLYWMNESLSLREVKEAIGSKLIWKFRLRFFTDLEDFFGTKEKTELAHFTKEEQNILEDMRKSA
jgi:hypothetical protein